MKVKVCVIQDSPVFFDKEKTLIKVEELVSKYANEGCELIVFPEAYFAPCFILRQQPMHDKTGQPL